MRARCSPERIGSRPHIPRPRWQESRGVAKTTQPLRRTNVLPRKRLRPYAHICGAQGRDGRGEASSVSQPSPCNVLVRSEEARAFPERTATARARNFATPREPKGATCHCPSYVSSYPGLRARLLPDGETAARTEPRAGSPGPNQLASPRRGSAHRKVAGPCWPPLPGELPLRFSTSLAPEDSHALGLNPGTSRGSRSTVSGSRKIRPQGAASLQSSSSERVSPSAPINWD